MFYLYQKPPECVLDLEKIEKLLLKRFQLYSLPTALQHDTEEFNYYDRVSHLFMCLVVICHPQFKNAFMQGEMKLFRNRLESEKCFDIKKELSEASDFLETLSQSKEFIIVKSVCWKQFQLIQRIIQALLSKSSHCFKKFHKSSCRKYKLTLPFTCLLKLVSRREIEVKNGKVSLSCGLWNEVLEIIFEFLLKIEIALIENSEDLKEIFGSEDDRIRQIVQRMIRVLCGCSNNEKAVVEANEIDERSLYFPPCMAQLHQILRQTHRLSYDSRYQYTLFLRDIGVSVEENILFWEEEYNKPHEGSACTHCWTDNGKRYKYQIKHLYGLIGSHNPRTSHSCEKFIKELGPKMNGGCPFEHFTSEQLENALPKSFMNLPDVEDLFMYKNNQMSQKACAVYLNCLKKVLVRQRENFFDADVNLNKCFQIISPLQFYNLARSF